MEELFGKIDPVPVLSVSMIRCCSLGLYCFTLQYSRPILVWYQQTAQQMENNRLLSHKRSS